MVREHFFMNRLVITIFFGCIASLAAAQTTNDVKALFKQLETAQEDTAKATLYVNISKFYWNKNLDSALLMANHAIDLATDAHYEAGLATALLSKGVIYNQVGKYSDAMECYFQVLRLCEKIDSDYLLRSSYNNLGIVYINIDNLPMALDYFQKALAIAQKSKQPKEVFPILVNIAELLTVENKLDEALQYNTRALSISKEEQDSLGTAIILFNIGDIYRRKGNFDKALINLDHSLEISRKLNDKEGIAYSYNSIAELYVARGNYVLSTRFALLSLNESSQAGNVELQQHSFGILAEGYKHQQKYKEALHYRELEVALNDSIYNIEKDKAVAKLQSTYELEKKQYQIDLLNKDKIIQQKELTREKFTRNTFIVGVILLSLLILFLIRTNSTKEKINDLLKNRNKEILLQKKEILQQNRRLEELNAVKNKLLSVISHDLRSPLHSLQGIINLMNTANLSGEELSMLFERAGKTLGHTSHLLDNLLYWARSQMEGAQVNPEHFELINTVQENVRLMQTQADDKKVSLEMVVPESVKVYADAAMIDIVIRNLLANAVKFSTVGDTVWVTVTVETKNVRVTVRDEGLGIRQEDQPKLFNRAVTFTTPGTSNEKGTGLGLFLCKELVEKNGGAIAFESEFGKGSSFSFTIPLGK